ncbi:MAG: ABC-F family ATP-binding cassette domain-containing protein [Planctomycetota bacterium]
MGTLLQLQNISKGYDGRVLLAGADLTIAERAKIGLIGRNGCGKSTLCRILTGQESPDAGDVVRHPILRLGYLQQQDPFLPGETVLAFLMRDTGRPDWRCGEVAWRFEFLRPDLDRPVTAISGGMQTRLKLAALMLHEPNLLILDEPTNFLDLRTQMLIEQFLKDFEGACLIVSHDRAFLNATCTRTVEVSRGKMTAFPGNVEAFLVRREECRVHDERFNAAVIAKRRQLQTFVDRNRVGAKTASRAQSKLKQMERLRIVEIVGAEKSARIRVPEVAARQGTALRCSNLAIGYGDLRVAEGIDLDIDAGGRIAVVGDNGQGKTTFLRTVTGSLPALAGSVFWGHGSDIGIYAQHVYTGLPEEATVLAYLRERAAPDVRAQTILDVAGGFLFAGPDVEKPVSVLSGGERARLCLAGLLLGGYTVLALDEPGTHLDVESLEALTEALAGYRGTVIFTSHDRRFVERLATGVIEVKDGRVVHCPGNFEAYRYRLEREVAEFSGPGSSAGGKAAAAPRLDTRKELARRRYELGREVVSAERQLARHESRMKELEARLVASADPDPVARLAGEMEALKAKIAAVEDRWLALQEECAALDEAARVEHAQQIESPHRPFRA